MKGSRIPANASVIPNSPTRGMKSRADGPLVLESQTDVLDAHTHTQSVVNDLRRPANTSGMVRTPQSDCINLSSPGTKAGGGTCADGDANRRGSADGDVSRTGSCGWLTLGEGHECWGRG